MANNFKINFEYKSIGKKASAGRSAALKAQKGMKGLSAPSAISSSRADRQGRQGTIISQRENKQSIGVTKKLDSSIIKLIASNKELAKEQKKASRGGGSSSRVAGAVGKAAGGSAGFGRIGAAIPILGAAIAAIGFTIQKVNQVGNAFIQKASEQIGSVGVGGFQSGRGTYSASQMGSGMKAYRMATGEFGKKKTITSRVKTADAQTISRGSKAGVPAHLRGKVKGTEPKRIAAKYKNVKKTVNVRPDEDQTAMDIGAIYGLSAEDTFKTAGQFQRGGGDFKKSAYMAAGSGIQTELPMLLQGMAGIMTDAMREGINTSDMSTDMAKEISALTMATPGKSVEAALNIVKSFQGVQKQVSGGQMGSVEGLYTARASQRMLMENLGKKSYVKDLTSRGIISGKQAEAISGLGSDASFEQLMKVAPGAAFPLLRQATAEADPAKLQRTVTKDVKKQFGGGAEGFQRFSDFALQTGFSQNQSQIKALWDADNADMGGSQTYQSGQAEISKRARGVRGSAAGMAISQQNRRDNMVFQYGAKFAEASLKMEGAMLRLAEGAAPAAIAGITAVGQATTALAKGLDGLGSKLKTMNSVSSGLSGLFN